MATVPMETRRQREHDRYQRLVRTADLRPDTDLSPRAQVVLAWLAKDEMMTAGVVEIITAARSASR